MANLGVMYENGLGVEKNADEAFKYLSIAAVGGEPHAQTQLGLMFRNGAEGGEPNHKLAAVWWRRAADQGFPTAQALLGFAYSFGEGVAQDYVAAHMWMNLAADSLPPGQQRDTAIQMSERIAKSMTPQQIAEAQKLARKWKPQVQDGPK
jgi:TPR repeat protein